MASRLSLFLALCAFSAAGLSGADTATSDKLNGLLNNSPFGTSKNGAQAGNNPNDPLEFRAVLVEGGINIYSIYETATHRSNWVGLNDPVNGFSVKSYDQAHENITLEYQGKTLTLAIKRAPAVAQAMQPPMAVPFNGPVPGNGAPGVGPVPSPSSPMDQQRLQQIQEEIRRRRALRNQAGGSTNSGPQPIQRTGGGEGVGPQPYPQNGAQNTGARHPGEGGSVGPQYTPSTSTGPQPLPTK